ncbi:MAG TPA: hypothetical protein VHG33_03465 [Woeseiaceae bacterium]|nr:hypothetical protein [Woeseiaceae bacterium]
MNVFSFVIALVTVVLCARLIQVYIETRNNRSRAAEDMDVEQTVAKIEALEDRVRVLERIITENRFDLKQEIDGL